MKIKEERHRVILDSKNVIFPRIIPYSIAKSDHDCDRLSCKRWYQSLSLYYIIISSTEVEKLTHV